MAVTPYASPTHLQSRLPSGGAAFTAAETGTHQLVLDALSRAIDGYCRRGFYRQTQTLVFTADNPLCLEVPDLVSITTLKTDANNDGVYETTWAVADYILSPPNAPSEEPPAPYTRIEYSRRTGSGGHTFPVTTQYGTQIVGVWGWPAVPDPVRECTILASLNFLGQLSAPSGVVVSEALGAFVVSPAFTKLANLMLTPFVKKGMAAAVGGGGY